MPPVPPSHQTHRFPTCYPARPRNSHSNRSPPGSWDSDQRPIKIVPKGLRSFDEHDADFFLGLVPGPRDRDGLPESIRFWKRRIDSTDSDKTFRVGLIYGPSGCGKSSLVKAGLLPRLAKHVLAVYIEATPEETESRLLKGLRKVCPQLPPQDRGWSIRWRRLRGTMLLPGQKVLLVLDQFEQWLHAKRGEENTELAAASAMRRRACPGGCDGAGRLLDRRHVGSCGTWRRTDPRRREMPCVDLFDPRHAGKVLRAFGRAYGNLPESDRRHPGIRTLSSIMPPPVWPRTAASSWCVWPVCRDGQGEAVDPATFREVGGTQGIGLTFLEETFSASTATPEHRQHQKAAQAVLKALLPESGQRYQGADEITSAVARSVRLWQPPQGFCRLIPILDQELRLITPTDPEGSAIENPADLPSGQYYQLAHDYLVHSLRDWLIRKQRETRRGRAELRLAERSSLWNAKPENRHLPSAQPSGQTSGC